MSQSTPPHGGAKNATNELFGVWFCDGFEARSKSDFENQDRHPKAARSAALTRGRREAPPDRPTARKALRAGVLQSKDQ